MWTFLKCIFALSLINYICGLIYSFSPIVFCALIMTVIIMFVYALCLDVPPPPPKKDPPPPPPVEKTTDFDRAWFALRVASAPKARRLFPRSHFSSSSKKNSSDANNYSSSYGYGSDYDNDFDSDSPNDSWSSDNSWNDYSDSGGDSDSKDSD